MNFTQNGLIAALAPADQRLLRAGCEPTSLHADQLLLATAKGPRNVYFLVGASVALVARNGSGPGAAVGLIGFEGAVGLQFCLGLGPSRFGLLVQTHGPAWAIPGTALKRMAEASPTLLMTLARYLWTAAEELGEFAAAIKNQTVSQRLASWILRSRGADPADGLLLTHSHIASMLGVRRASVSMAANELRDQGLLDYSRGRIHVLDRRRLQALSQSVR